MNLTPKLALNTGVNLAFIVSLTLVKIEFLENCMTILVLFGIE